MSIRTAEKQLAFVVEYEGPIPSEVRSDPKRLKQVLVNLIGNAIKFTESGSVQLKVRYLSGEERPEEGPRLEFSVIDTGIGISEEHVKHLFQPFSQGDSSVGRAYGGTGLGLAISRRLAKLLGGQITVTSRPNHGSTFTCAIAAEQVDGAHLIEPSPTESDPDPKNDGDLPVKSPVELNCRVLVVDDRRDIRFLVERLLTGVGANVVTAEDGSQALEIVSEMLADGGLADLILLDMQMPHLDGYQTARRLREMGYRQPIVALTANVMDGDMDECLSSGCDAYTGKPIDAGELLGIVERFLQRKTEG